MILDDPWIEAAYLILITIAWLWALSQLRYAVRYGGAWRWITAYWLASKAAFFTVAGSVWWTNHLNETVFRLALYSLVTAHLIAFIKWITLPKTTALAPEPRKGSGSTV